LAKVPLRENSTVAFDLPIHCHSVRQAGHPAACKSRQTYRRLSVDIGSTTFSTPQRDRGIDGISVLPANPQSGSGRQRLLVATMPFIARTATRS